MNILEIKKVEKERIEVDNENSSLPQKWIHTEDEEERPEVYINDEWKYVMGRNTINFIFLKVSSRMVYGGDNDTVIDVLYFIELWSNGILFQLEIPQNEYYDKKWLKEIKSGVPLLISKNNYETLISIIEPKPDTWFYFDKIGIHKKDGNYYYVTSNCSVTKKGVDDSVRALQEGFNLQYADSSDKEKELEEKEIIETFIKYNQWNYRVFYPIHCVSIIAVLRYFLKKQGISAGAVLWIDGRIASGKTELATTMGDFFNRGEDVDGKKKHLLSTKARVSKFAGELKKFRNAVVILDDIKKEETAASREKAKNITDLLIRSIYTGKIGESGIEEETIDATAIITGEFFREQQSTVSRVMYLNIDNFLQDNENSSQFKEIQADTYYLARFMICFLRWFLGKTESEGNFFIKTLSHLQDDLSEYFYGELSTRMIETVANFQLVSEILNMYFEEKGVYRKSREVFYEDSKTKIRKIGEATLNRCLDYYPLIERCFKEVLPKLKIKDCRYGKEYLDALDDANYANDNSLYQYYNDACGISCNERLTRWKKIWLLGLQKEYEAIWFNVNGKEMLIVKEKVICSLIRECMKENMQAWQIKIYDSELVDERILTALLNKQCLYGYRRREGVMDKIIKFPEYDIVENGGWKIIQESENYSMVKVNIDSKIKLNGIKNIGKIPFETVEEIVNDSEKMSRDQGRHSGLSSCKKSLDDALAKMNRFLDLK